MEDLQTRVSNLYDFVRSDLYLCQDDLALGSKSYNSTLLFALLTQLNRGKMLIFGEYGGGKTTSAEYIHSLCNSMPLDLMRRVVLRGDPQRVRETMIGRPHYGKLHGEEEVAIWKQFVLVGPKTIDEFNRIVEGNQSIVLDGVDRGIWECMDQFIETGPQPFFATCNYADDGNFALIPPMLDRFHIAVESAYCGVAEDDAISNDFHNDKDAKLLRPDLMIKATELFQNAGSYNLIKEGLEKIATEYRSHLDSENIPSLTVAERERAGQEISKMPLSKSAHTYFLFLAAELNVSAKRGMKRSTDRPTNENGNYLEACFRGSGSRRVTRAIKQYARSMAWFQGKKEVSMEHMMSVAPYALWHRLKWEGKVKSSFNESERRDPLDLHIAKVLCNGGTQNFPGIKKRALDSAPNYENLCRLVVTGKMQEARQLALECSEEGKGHPIFIDATRSLGRVPSQHFLRLAKVIAGDGVVATGTDLPSEPIAKPGPVTGYIAGGSYVSALLNLRSQRGSELPMPYHNAGDGLLRPLTGAESIRYLLEHHEANPSDASKFLQKGFDSCSALVVDRANREYKVITCAKELFTGNVNGQIGVRFADFDVAPIGYDNGKYNQSLSQSEAESHPGWRQFFEGDEDLHKKFTELVYSRSGDRRSSGSEMSFIIPPGSESTPMMFPIYVQGLRNGSRLSGVNGSNVKTSFLLLGKQE